jgi:nicotinamide mononucleotide transporter
VTLIAALAGVASTLLLPAFTAWGSPVTWLELLATVLTLGMVWANWRVHVVAWPLAIASSLLYALLFANSRLYGEAGLQGVFVAIALWGWWCWWRPFVDPQANPAGALGVRRMAPRQRIWALLLTAVAWPLLALLLARTTDSDVPYLDALPTVASITGQVLLGRKWLENWPVWVAVNIFSVGLFAYKGLWLTAMLYAVLTALALWGWRVWWLLLQQQAGTSPAAAKL